VLHHTCISRIINSFKAHDYYNYCRAAEEPSAGLYVEAVSLWDALSSHAPLCCLGGPVLAAAIRFGIAADADANTDTVLEVSSIGDNKSQP
jgi:hypothetical protein